MGADLAPRNGARLRHGRRPTDALPACRTRRVRAAAEQGNQERPALLRRRRARELVGEYEQTRESRARIAFSSNTSRANVERRPPMASSAPDAEPCDLVEECRARSAGTGSPKAARARRIRTSVGGRSSAHVRPGQHRDAAQLDVDRHEWGPGAASSTAERQKRACFEGQHWFGAHRCRRAIVGSVKRAAATSTSSAPGSSGAAGGSPSRGRARRAAPERFFRLAPAWRRHRGARARQARLLQVQQRIENT